MSIVTFKKPAHPRQVRFVNLTRFGVYGGWNYPNQEVNQAHDGSLTKEEVMTITKHVIEQHKLPFDHPVCVEYNQAQKNACYMTEKDYERVLYSIMQVTNSVEMPESILH